MPLLLTCLLLFALLPLPALADDGASLYEAAVPVTDHGERQRKQGTRAALAQVLVKLSGSRVVLDDPSVAASLQRADDYMQKYKYQRPDRETLEMAVTFDSELVSKGNSPV